MKGIIISSAVVVVLLIILLHLHLRKQRNMARNMENDCMMFRLLENGSTREMVYRLYSASMV
jgi:hypothetical protein